MNAIRDTSEMVLTAQVSYTVIKSENGANNIYHSVTWWCITTFITVAVVGRVYKLGVCCSLILPSLGTSQFATVVRLSVSGDL